MGVHVLAVLAYKEGATVSSGLLAASVNTHPVVIRRLLLALQAAGLITTGKGAGSGSRLSRAPSKISLAEVYRAVETDEPFALHSKRPSQSCPVGRCIEAALEKVFASAESALERELGQTNFAEILQMVKACCEGSRRGRN